MMNRLLILLALASFAAVPFTLGIAETKEAAPHSEGAAKEGESKEGEPHKEAAAPVKKKKSVAPGECLASAEVINDLEEREKQILDKEAALVEKQKEVDAQLKAVQDELAKLEAKQTEIQGARAKELAANEEKVNKLIETLETMSPKAAAGVIGGVDEELAVTALTRITSVKAGKILSNLKNDKSARLSELMAFGKLNQGKEKKNGESTERSPANKQ